MRKKGTARRVFRKFRLVGTVQGVGFRHFLRQRAEAVGATGWAKNETDGSLIVLLAGRAGAVDEMSVAVQSGPPGCDIVGSAELVVEENDIVKLPQSFSVY